MTAEDLYEDIKHALRFFGLSFHQMHLVQVQIQNNQLTLTYDNRSITIGQ